MRPMPKLPVEVLRQRLKNELEMCRKHCKHMIKIDDPELSSFPVKVEVTMIQTPGPVLKHGSVGTKLNHRFIMTITDQYPYEKPIVEWKTMIFHPNIMVPQDGGNVCSLLLDNWNFSSNVLSFIRGLESLLLFPNAKNPFGTDSCIKAARYFHTHDFDPQVDD